MAEGVTIKAKRLEFNNSIAPNLAALTGGGVPWQGAASSKFAYLVDGETFVIVAGDQEGTDVDYALAYGLGLRGTRRLRLLLPVGLEFPTRQRASCLRADYGVELFVHDGATVERVDIPSVDEAVANLDEVRGERSFEEELAYAATPAHLGARAQDVERLAEWAARHPQLDSGHRRGERSWHCVGQRVLSIKRSSEGVSITAGIHYSKPGERPTAALLAQGTSLDDSQFEAIKHQVELAVGERVHDNGRFCRPDEHWLQAVIRARPSLAGVEHPALREVPAWRPAATEKRWSRGFIDLVGVDAHGDIRVVETKLARNRDDLMILQGVDYYLWALAYADALRRRLGVSTKSSILLHYLIGADTDGKIHISPYAADQAAALAIPWRCQHDWFRRPGDYAAAQSELLAVGALVK